MLQQLRPVEAIVAWMKNMLNSFASYISAGISTILPLCLGWCGTLGLNRRSGFPSRVNMTYPSPGNPAAMYRSLQHISAQKDPSCMKHWRSAMRRRQAFPTYMKRTTCHLVLSCAEQVVWLETGHSRGACTFSYKLHGTPRTSTEFHGTSHGCSLHVLRHSMDFHGILWIVQTLVVDAHCIL